MKECDVHDRTRLKRGFVTEVDFDRVVDRAKKVQAYVAEGS